MPRRAHHRLATRIIYLSLYCAGCHGLEYLPALPREFQSMLALVDDLHDGYRQAKTARAHSRRGFVRRDTSIAKVATQSSGVDSPSNG